MLEQTFEAVLEVRDTHLHQGRPRVECTLASDDGQTLYLYEGHLKELGKNAPELEKGKRYKALFRPFVNNRWLEIKLIKLEPA